MMNLTEYGQRNKTIWWIVTISGAAATLFSLTQLHTFSHTQIWQFVSLLMVIVFAGRMTIAMPGGAGTVSPTDALIFLAAFFLGTPAATIAAALNGYVATSNTNRRPEEIIYGAGTLATATSLASSLMYRIINAQSEMTWRDLSNYTGQLDWLMIASVALIGIYFVVSSALTAVFQAWKKGENPVQFWVSHQLWLALYIFAVGFITTVICVLVRTFSPYYLLLIIPVLAASFAACKSYFAKVELTSYNLNEISRLHFATVEALATAIDAKDQVSHEHVRRVQIYTAGMGRILGLPQNEIEALHAGALMHDIGKLAVPDHILNKPGKLTSAEFEKMKIHTTVGARILERVGFPYPVVPIVKYHHERWDGKGYPEGLKEENIPITARILSIVDCFDAMREARAYRPALGREEACRLLNNQSGKHFDPALVETFLENLPEFEAAILAAGLSLEATMPMSLDVVEDYDLIHQNDHFNQIASAHNEMSSLYEIARTFSTSLDLADTASIFANKLKDVIPFDTCVIYLYDDERQCLRANHAVGKFAEAFTGRKAYAHDGITGWVLAHRRMFSNADPSLDLVSLEIPDGAFKTLAITPMMRGEELVGVLALYSSALEQYSPDNLRLLDSISGLAADSIYNAINHAETREFALTDALTGMPNSRALHFQFAQESNRASRQGTALSVLMMDLDGFKNINDTYGHHAGNEFLIGIAKVIGNELRSYDYLARYAGDEFVALLPGATEEDVEDLMWRIHRAVEAYQLPSKEGFQARAGISLGSARFSLEANSLERLLRISDRRMYKNKQLRRQYEFLMEGGEMGDTVAQAIGRN